MAIRDFAAKCNFGKFLTIWWLFFYFLITPDNTCMPLTLMGVYDKVMNLETELETDEVRK